MDVKCLEGCEPNADILVIMDKVPVSVLHDFMAMTLQKTLYQF